MRRGLVAIVAVVAAPLLAQERATVNVNLIEVPVTVATRGGDPVRGLTAANFALFDDGKQQPIASFDTIDFAAKDAPASAIAPMNPAARRAFMLLFDLGCSSPAALSRARDAARKFVAEAIGPRDLVAVATIDPEHSFRLVTTFTTDRALIAAAIDDPAAFQGTDPLQLTNVTRTFEATHGEDFSDVRGQPRNEAEARRIERMDIANNATRELAADNAHANEAFTRGCVEKQVDTLGLLAAALQSVPGRKQVIFLTEGFDAKHLRGRDVRDTRGMQNDPLNAAGDSGNVGGRSVEGTPHGVRNVDSEARYGNSAGMKLLREMAQRFTASDVVLHAIDIRGLRVLNDAQSGAKIDNDDALYLLARPTGGEVFDNANSLVADFNRMLRRQEVVYVLGFYAHRAKPGALHRLAVNLAGVPNATASYRLGYDEGRTRCDGARCRRRPADTRSRREEYNPRRRCHNRNESENVDRQSRRFRRRHAIHDALRRHARRSCHTVVRENTDDGHGHDRAAHRMRTR